MACLPYLGFGDVMTCASDRLQFMTMGIGYFVVSNLVTRMSLVLMKEMMGLMRKRLMID